jgi:hypothetical protein
LVSKELKLEMRKRKSAQSRILILFVAIIIVMIIVVGLFLFEPKSNLPIRISYSLDPSTVKENEPAKLIFSITNVNETFHDIRFVFITTSRLKIYAGADELLKNNTYNFTIDSYERDQDREFTVVGSLEENIASSKYQIQLQVFLNEKIIPELSKTISLTITRT